MSDNKNPIDESGLDKVSGGTSFAEDGKKAGREVAKALLTVTSAFGGKNLQKDPGAIDFGGRTQSGKKK